MNVLIVCEAGGVVRDAFRRRGHHAVSADLRPCSADPTHHYQGDMWDVIGEGWDLLIAHPTCTYLTIAAEWAYGDGPYHQAVKPGTLVGAERREAREQALDDFRRLLAAPIPRIAIENPVGVAGTRIRKPDQSVQPYEFGSDASKRTCFWLKGLPPLVAQPAWRVPGRMVEWPRGSGRMVERWANQTDSGQNNLSPSADRWSTRSHTYPGIAAAMAAQWGG